MKKPHPLTDLDPFPIPGPHYNQPTRHVPALYLLSLIDSEELKVFPQVEAYIQRAIRQLRAEALEDRKIEEGGHD